MLIYTSKLEKYVVRKILPQLLFGANYEIKGSFKRRVPYVTDIDIVSRIENHDDLYNKIIKKLREFQSTNNILLVQITCGIDARFSIREGTDQEFDSISNILSKFQQLQLSMIRKKYADDMYHWEHIASMYEALY